MVFDPDLFCTPLTPQRAERVFKKCINTIEMSISSYCNRRCPYCPNSRADRLSRQHLMTDGLFFNILRQLCKIGYDGDVHIHRFNEPLADRAYALRRVREIKTFLPDCKVTIFTNGDYLDADYVRELAEAGADTMFATVHEAANGTSFADLLDDQDRRLARLGLPFEYSAADGGGVRVAHVDTGTSLRFNFMAQDFRRRDAEGVMFMEDRGQSLPVAKGMARTKPCFMPFLQMQIEWDGELLPCCQIQPDVFEPGRYSLGKLDERSDIFLAWTSERYVRWRIELFNFEPKKAPCATCAYGGPLEVSDEVRAAITSCHAVLRPKSAIAAPAVAPA